MAGKRPKDIPGFSMRNVSGSGVFIKRFSRLEKTTMRHFAHHDDYFMIVMLTAGSAVVTVDFERKELSAGDLIVVSPWQVHGRPDGGVWEADGWIIAFSPEMLSEQEMCAVEEYSICPSPFSPGEDIVGDILSLCSMTERYKDDHMDVYVALAAAIRNLALSTMKVPAGEVSGRYMKITVGLKKLLDRNLHREKSPAAYASMLNISEVYLNEAVKGVTGLSAGAYIRGQVMIRAKRMLVHSSRSAKEIACALGYVDYAYFSKLFTKQEGVSPSEYRKNLK